jgi:hypothetical protein
LQFTLLGLLPLLLFGSSKILFIIFIIIRIVYYIYKKSWILF